MYSIEDLGTVDKLYESSASVPHKKTSSQWWLKTAVETSEGLPWRHVHNWPEKPNHSHNFLFWFLEDSNTCNSVYHWWNLVPQPLQTKTAYKSWSFCWQNHATGSRPTHKEKEILQPSLSRGCRCSLFLASSSHWTALQIMLRVFPVPKQGNRSEIMATHTLVEQQCSCFIPLAFPAVWLFTLYT